jgi:hypothetical protein
VIDTALIEAPAPIAMPVAAPARKLPPGVMTSKQIEDEAYARILLVGAAKIGKTTCLLQTAPRPLIINADGKGATQYAAKSGADYLEIPARNVAEWDKARAVARQLVAAGEIDTIIVDSYSLLSEKLIEDLLETTADKRQAFGKLRELLVGGYNKLAMLEAHLFVVAHLQPAWEGIAGVLPLVQGSAKDVLPAMVADWVLFDYEPKRDPQRGFVVGPQGEWTASGRHIKRSCIVPPDAKALLAELGFKP